MKQKTKIISILTLSIIILSLSIISIQSEQKIEANAETINSKKVEWGIKRNENHEQPDLGASRIKTLSQNNGIAIGNKESKKIYLTFDNGYEAGYTSKILQTLKETQVSATFFITAHYLNTQPELVKQMIEEGHIVGNHTPKFLMSGNDKSIKC